MPRKGMRSLCFSPRKSPTSSSSIAQFSSPSRFGFSPSRPSFSESVMNRTIDMAEPMIEKWNPDATTFAKFTSLFYENRREARDFIKCVNNLQKAMHFMATENSSSDKLVRAHSLMQIAMKRLQKEFYQSLSINRAHLDPESVSTRSSRTSTWSSTSEDRYDEDDEEDTRAAADSIEEVEDVSTAAMADLKLIADCMISSGYGKECVKIYKIIRKSIIDEGIYKLGVEKMSASQVHKMDWEVLDLRIKSWLEAVPITVKTLFNGERILCDHVFASSDSIRESCFTEISKDAAMILLGFPENVAKNSRKSPEKIFRCLDMYTAIAEQWPEIESIFCFNSSSAIVIQAVNSLIKLGESIRVSLKEFESSLQKDSSKSVVAGAGIHHLTIDAMDYLSIVADYSMVLGDILAEAPLPEKSSLPKSYFDLSDSDDAPAPSISLHFAWMILVLLCKLDVKAKHYKDVSFAYLFLANNIKHILQKVRSSSLRHLLGDDWISKHEAKVKQFASNYERLGWSQVSDSLPKLQAMAAMSPEEVKESFKRFNSSFEQAYRKHTICVVADTDLREDIKASIEKKVVPAYREFYNMHRVTMARERNSASTVRFSPEDVVNRLSDLFFAPAVPWSSSSSRNSFSSRSAPSGSH